MPKSKVRSSRRTPRANSGGTHRRSSASNGPAVHGETSGARRRGRPPGSSKRLEFDVQEFIKELPHMEAVQWIEVECPYCGESFDVRADPSWEFSNFTQTCQVCCKTMALAVESDDGELSVHASRC